METLVEFHKIVPQAVIREVQIGFERHLLVGHPDSSLHLDFGEIGAFGQMHRDLLRDALGQHVGMGVELDFAGLLVQRNEDVTLAAALYHELGHLLIEIVRHIDGCRPHHQHFLIVVRHQEIADDAPYQASARLRLETHAVQILVQLLRIGHRRHQTHVAVLCHKTVKRLREIHAGVRHLVVVQHQVFDSEPEILRRLRKIKHHHGFGIAGNGAAVSVVRTQVQI